MFRESNHILYVVVEWICLFLSYQRMAFRISLLLLLIATPPVQAQTSITGRIIDLDGGGPLANVRVSRCDPASSSHDVHLPTWTNAQAPC